MAFSLTDTQRGVLRLLTDTVVPRIERPADPTGFWARTGTDLGVEQGVEQLIAGIPDEMVQGGLAQLLDVLEAQGFTRAPSQLSREQIMTNICLASPEAAAGLGALTGMVTFLAYGAPDPQTGANPNWETFGFGGPTTPPPAPVAPDFAPLTPEDGATLEADVVVVGSGAGGGVIAGTLAQQGRKVIVLEAGGMFSAADFFGLELKAYQDMWWHGGPVPTADGNVSLQAGATFGGGTTINWTNCLRTTPWVREEWAREHGLEGVDSADYDRHLDHVLRRIGATDKLSDLNKPQQNMKKGCEALGWSFKTIIRNADPATYSPASAGFLGFGDVTDSKLSTAKTFLRDAAEHGAEMIVRCRADRVLVENGRAAGVEATFTGEDGAPRRIEVRAPTVVVAGGSLESPALLLRSGIGGPAAGDYLRLHPCLLVMGLYSEDQEAWWGAPHAGLADEFADTGSGHGFLVEGTQYSPGLVGSAVPWVSGAAHKEMMSQVRYGANFIALTRDHGHGRVVLDPRGESAPFYDVTDAIDLANLRLAIEKISRLHEAAGAHTIISLAAGLPQWRRGDDLDRFIAGAQQMPMKAGYQKLFSAHQMGSCRMGPDPQTSVANPWGELHDVPGVWIGDGSAFPSASGTNPMVSIMALAHRTAEAITGTTDDSSAQPLQAATAR
jgi:choline dehydrogenase-like flavoprotein